MDTRKALYGTIGIAAFIIGGIVTRAKALEMAETVEDFFAGKTSDNPPSAEL